LLYSIRNNQGENMKYSKLGRTDLEVSRCCLGTMTWGEQNTESEAHEQMDYALEHGVNFWDTAELYSIPIRAETQGIVVCVNKVTCYNFA
jgi:predicted aldo/keto reductase-like oxidoreductase